MNKSLYKLELWLLKVMPALMSICFIIYNLLSYLHIDASCIRFLGCTSLLTLILFYVTSYTFKFCFIYRMFLHYITINVLLFFAHNLMHFDSSCEAVLHIMMVVLGIFIFIIFHNYAELNKKAIIANYREYRRRQLQYNRGGGFKDNKLFRGFSFPLCK